eukprot:gene25586-11239_t
MALVSAQLPRSAWSTELQQLIDSNILNGFALLTAKGVVHPVVGILQAEFASEDIARMSLYRLASVDQHGSLLSTPLPSTGRDPQNNAGGSCSVATSPRPLTPLERREWSRTAQRAIRIALTGLKDVTSRFKAGTDSGHKALAELSNVLLSVTFLKSLKLGSLDQLPGGGDALKVAAAGKLSQQLSSLLMQLGAACDDLQQAAEALANSLDLSLRSAPIFACLPAATCAEMSAEVAGMYSKELTARLAVYRNISEGVAAVNAVPSAPAAAQPQGPAAAAPPALTAPAVPPLGSGDHEPGVGDAASRTDGGTAEERERDASCIDNKPAVNSVAATLTAVMQGAKGRVGRDSDALAEPLRNALTVQLSVWILSPHIDEDRVEELLGAMTEDMAGF